MAKQLPEQEPQSEIITIIETEAYWNIGRLGCHDIQPPRLEREPSGLSEISDRKRKMRAYYDEEGNWTVSIDPA